MTAETGRPQLRIPVALNLPQRASPPWLLSNSFFLTRAKGNMDAQRVRPASEERPARFGFDP